MKKQMILLGMLMAFCMAEAKVTLPALFTDNMVLQQKSNVIFHGHSSTKKEVIIKTGWNKHPYTTSPDKEGNWKIEVPTPSAGGPYEIIISDGDEHILQNILIGEIWLYTGECETETPIDIPSQPYIRLFQTKKEISLVPKKDLHATQEGWKECTSETITGLPAIGYFFASQLQKNLKATLRPYQQKGFSWMVHLHKQGFGGCLADDMGLGKTLQTLTLLQYIYKPSTPRQPATLIVVPTSLLHNWRREAKRFTALSMAEYNNTMAIDKEQPEKFFGHFHLIFTTYGMMRNNIDILCSYRFEYIVLDESQNIKNSESLTFRSAIRLQSKHRLVLTGTPIENSLKDLWAQFHFIQPDLLGTENAFQKQFIMPIRQGNARAKVLLQQLTAPFILRRSKKEVAPELPALTEETIYCDMTEEQNTCYEQEKNSLRNILLQHPQSTDRLHSFSVLNGILRLRQLSCHPQLILPDYTGTSGKTAQIIETFDTLQSEGHKVLIFSSFVRHLEVLAEAFHERGWKYALLTGSTNNRPSEIAHFTDQKDVQAFLISLKAGGVGLNLTQADYVFIIDPWWKPASHANPRPSTLE
jgi:SNF2 family DNA or RNA helicase